MTTVRWTAVLVLAGSAIGLAACAGAPDGREGALVESGSARNQSALVEARLAPRPAALAVRYFQWVDRHRQREVLAKLYLPPATFRRGPVPLVVL